MNYSNTAQRMKHSFATMPPKNRKSAQQKGVRLAQFKARWQRQLQKESNQYEN